MLSTIDCDLPTGTATRLTDARIAAIKLERISACTELAPRAHQRLRMEARSTTSILLHRSTRDHDRSRAGRHVGR